MVESIVTWTIMVLGKMGYFGVFILMALESACIPIPSEAILPFGGCLCSPAYIGNGPRLNLYLVILFGTIGGTCGSIFAYYLGAYGGRPLVDKYAHKLHLSKEKIQKSDAYFNKYGEKIVFYSRLLPIIRTFISLPAGLAKMDFKKFAAYTFFGSLLWSIVLGYAGYVMGNNWVAIRKWFHIADYLVAGVIVLFIAYLIIKKLKKRDK